MNSKSQGFTLMEMMIALALSLVVVLTMSRLTVDTFSTGTKTVEMAKLSYELRSTMELLSRDVRRASFTSNAILCFANVDCASDGSVNLPGDVYINADHDCVTYLHDRNEDGDATNDSSGGFRLSSVSGVGVVQTWTGGSAPDCTSTAGEWRAITDPGVIDVFSFQVDDDQSYTEVIDVDAAGNPVRQKIRKIHMLVSARLVRNAAINRTVGNTVLVRNNLVL